MMEMDAVKAEKETAMRRYRRIQSAWRLLRWLLEACAAALLLSWSSARLPAAARASGDLLRAAVAAALTPRFGFFLANVIVAVLFAKSRSLTSSSSTSSTSPPFESNIYEEFLETRGRVCYALAAPEPVAVADKEVVYEEKKVPTETKSCRRSRSEKLPKRRKASPEPELRRSATYVAKKIAGEEKKDEEEEEEEEWEGMGEEEFRRTVEAFIAKQLRFQREESMAVVCSSGGPPESGAQKT